MTGKSFEASFVYGMHSTTDRRPLWTSLGNIGSLLFDPWIVLGDFNCVLYPTDRTSGIASSYDIKEFSDCCIQLGLENLNTSGAFHTWSNGVIWFKIDRVLCNNSWYSHFPSSFCVVPGLESTSDHAPLIVTTELAIPIGKSLLRFNNALVVTPSFLDCVRSAWNLGIHGCHMNMVCKKLKTLKTALRSVASNSISKLSERVQ